MACQVRYISCWGVAMEMSWQLYLNGLLFLWEPPRHQLPLCQLYGCWTPMPRVHCISPLVQPASLCRGGFLFLAITTLKRSVWRSWASESSLATRLARHVGTKDGLQGMTLWCLTSMAFMKSGSTSVTAKHWSQNSSSCYILVGSQLLLIAQRLWRPFQHFQLCNFEPKASPFEFYNMLAWLTDNTGLTPHKVYKSAPSCFSQFKCQIHFLGLIPFLLNYCLGISTHKDVEKGNARIQSPWCYSN